MTKRDDIEQSAWGAAMKVAVEMEIHASLNTTTVAKADVIARAIMAAKADALEAKDVLIAELVEEIFKVTEEWYTGEDGDDILASHAKPLRDLYYKALQTQDQSEGGVE
jgi:hypothetical protein